MDRNQPQWRINSSFSPPVSRRRRHQRVANETAIYGSSSSSRSRGSRNEVSSEQYPNHHHSVSDGALSYYGSPPENPQVHRWMPPVQRYDLGEFSTPSGGARPESSLFSQNNERRFASRVPSMSSSLGTPSPLSETSRWPSANKPAYFPPRNLSGHRPFMSKPVYPLVYRNPASDGELYGSSFSPDRKFQKTLTHLQMDASPDPNTSSSRREGFRWSNASSYDYGFSGDTIDITDHIGLDQTPRSPYMNSLARQQKCALCERLLWQKSPWSSRRIVRSTDMPVAGVLPCRHVFHADCLDETTPKSQIHEPPCPVCQKASEGSVSFSEPLQAVGDGSGSSSSSRIADWNEDEMGGNQSLQMPRRRGGSLLKSHFRKRFSFKGKTGKDLFGAKARDPSSSSSLPRDNGSFRE